MRAADSALRDSGSHLTTGYLFCDNTAWLFDKRVSKLFATITAFAGSRIFRLPPSQTKPTTTISFLYNGCPGFQPGGRHRGAAVAGQHEGAFTFFAGRLESTRVRFRLARREGGAGQGAAQGELAGAILTNGWQARAALGSPEIRADHDQLVGFEQSRPSLSHPDPVARAARAREGQQLLCPCILQSLLYSLAIALGSLDRRDLFTNHLFVWRAPNWRWPDHNSAAPPCLPAAFYLAPLQSYEFVRSDRYRAGVLDVVIRVRAWGMQLIELCS